MQLQGGGRIEWESVMPKWCHFLPLQASNPTQGNTYKSLPVCWLGIYWTASLTSPWQLDIGSVHYCCPTLISQVFGKIRKAVDRGSEHCLLGRWRWSRGIFGCRMYLWTSLGCPTRPAPASCQIIDWGGAKWNSAPLPGQYLSLQAFTQNGRSFHLQRCKKGKLNDHDRLHTNRLGDFPKELTAAMMSAGVSFLNLC